MVSIDRYVEFPEKIYRTGLRGNEVDKDFSHIQEIVSACK